MEKIYIKYGCSFIYESSDIGSIANFDPSNDLKIYITKIGDKYHCHCYINGVFIQIWCTKYSIRKIGE